MTETNSFTAWMIRDDGVEFPVIQHVYADMENPENSLYAAQWLYEHTLRKSAKKSALRYIGSCAVMLGEEEKCSPLQALFHEASMFLCTTITPEFVAAHCEEFSFTNGNLPAMNREIGNMLNREFIRAQYGGLFTNKPGCRELFFRLPEGESQLLDAAAAFTARHIPWIENVTAVYDSYPDTQHPDKLNLYEHKDGGGTLCINHLPPYYFVNRFGSSRTEARDVLEHEMAFNGMDTHAEGYFRPDIFLDLITKTYTYAKTYMAGQYMDRNDLKLLMSLAEYVDSTYELMGIRDFEGNPVNDDEVEVCYYIGQGLLDKMQEGWLPEELSKHCSSLPPDIWISYPDNGSGRDTRMIDTIDLNDPLAELERLIKRVNKIKKKGNS